MVKLTKIYTRTGDDGSTGLADGSRRAKNDPRIAAYGTLDEANAALGLALLSLDRPVKPIIARLQNDLFDLGADLATPEFDDAEKEKMALRITPAQVQRLEQEIDQLNADLSPLTSFVLPGGSAAAAHLHVARTILRRAERDMIAITQRSDETISAAARQFINRASDLLFVAARMANDHGKNDILWVPGAHRD